MSYINAVNYPNYVPDPFEIYPKQITLPLSHSVNIPPGNVVTSGGTAGVGSRLISVGHIGSPLFFSSTVSSPNNYFVLPSAAALVSAFPNLNANQAMFIPVFNSSSATLNFTAGTGGSGAPVIPGYGGYALSTGLLLVFTNVSAGTAAYSLF